MFDELLQLHRFEKPKRDSRYKKQYVNEQLDYFVGISNPMLRKLSRKYYNVISKEDLDLLMHSETHEYRLLALFILCDKINKSGIKDEKIIVDYYLNNLRYIDNWDLVDASAYYILGYHLYNIKDYSLLYKFSQSDNLWLKRISVVATNYMIRKDVFDITFDIVDNLLKDKHDLIHKANGWMLRNIGKKNRELLTEYIRKNYNRIPRTTLRYAIEHYPKEQRKQILKGEF